MYNTFGHTVLMQHTTTHVALHTEWKKNVCMYSHDIHYLLSFCFVATHNNSYCIAQRVMQLCMCVWPYYRLPTVIPLRCNTQQFVLHCIKSDTTVYVCIATMYTTFGHAAFWQHTTIRVALHKGWNNIVCMYSHDMRYLISYRFVATHDNSCCIAQRVKQYCVYVWPSYSLPIGIPVCCNTRQFDLHCTNGWTTLYVCTYMHTRKHTRSQAHKHAR